MSDLTDNWFYPSAKRIRFCIRFVKWTCDRLTEEADFGQKKIIFSDETHFDLGGYVNKQNFCIWGTKNLHAYIEKPTHPQRVTVWCGFCSRDINGLFSLENDQGEAVTVNGDRYRAMLNEFLFTKIEEENIDNIWFQQETTQPKLHSMFCALFLKIALSPRSSDSTPFAYYLWDAFKDKCYVDKPETIDNLKDNIHEAIGEIQLHTIDNVLKNWTNRVGILCPV